MRKSTTVKHAVYLIVLAACSGSDDRGSSGGAPMGPGGVYDIDPGCMLWSGGDYCDGQKYANIMVCEVAPSDACVESPSPTPSPNHTVYCCDAPCHRGTESNDGYCKDGKESYMCYEEQIPAFMAANGCEESSQSQMVCC